MAENRVLEAALLTTDEKLCWIALRRFDFKRQGCRPSYDTIARLMSCSRRHAVAVAAALIDKGYAERRTHPGRANWFRAIWPGFVPEGVHGVHPRGARRAPEEDVFEKKSPNAAFAAPLFIPDTLKATRNSAPSAGGDQPNSRPDENGT